MNLVFRRIMAMIVSMPVLLFVFVRVHVLFAPIRTDCQVATTSAFFAHYSIPEKRFPSPGPLAVAAGCLTTGQSENRFSATNSRWQRHTKPGRNVLNGQLCALGGRAGASASKANCSASGTTPLSAPILNRNECTRCAPLSWLRPEPRLARFA